MFSIWKDTKWEQQQQQQLIGSWVLQINAFGRAKPITIMERALGGKMASGKIPKWKWDSKNGTRASFAARGSFVSFAEKIPFSNQTLICNYDRIHEHGTTLPSRECKSGSTPNTLASRHQRLFHYVPNTLKVLCLIRIIITD